MPEISRFFGIRIAMFFNEHNPPHFHAMYEGQKATVNIRTLAISEGSFPPRARGLVIEWATLHQQELMDDWNRLRAGQEPVKITPLE
jgi:Domain of unknown function (DUF4160)